MANAIGKDSTGNPLPPRSLYLWDDSTSTWVKAAGDPSGYLEVILKNLEKAEDAAHTTGDKGIPGLVVRKDAAASLAGTDGDYTILIVDANGRLHVLDQNSAAILADTTAIKLSAAIMDDWDESDRAKVNPIAGQAGVAANAGATDALTQRVILASDDPAVTSLGTIDGKTPALGTAAMAASTPVTIASDDTLITALKTALETIDNFISGSRGLVTEDNSAAIKTAVELIDNAISGNEMQVDIADRTVFSPVTGSGAISVTLAPAAKFRLLRVEIHLSAAPTTSENFTITLDAGDGAAYDVNLVTRDLSASSETDIIETFGAGYEYEADDEIDIAYTNTDAATYGLRAVYELI